MPQRNAQTILYLIIINNKMNSNVLKHNITDIDKF